MKWLGMLVAVMLAACGGDQGTSPSNQAAYLVQGDSVQYQLVYYPDSFTYYSERWLRPYPELADGLVTLTEDSTARLTGSLVGYFQICDLLSSTPVGPEMCEGRTFEALLAFFHKINARGEYRWVGDTLVITGPQWGFLASGGEFQTLWLGNEQRLQMTAGVTDSTQGLEWSAYIPWLRQ